MWNLSTDYILHMIKLEYTVFITAINNIIYVYEAILICVHILVYKTQLHELKVSWCLILVLIKMNMAPTTTLWGTACGRKGQSLISRVIIFCVPCQRCLFPFDDHAFFRLPLRHNCPERYICLSLYSMMSSLTEFFVVWRIRKLILTELLLEIIWRGLAFCLLGFTARCKFILWIGKVKLLLLLLVFWPWYLLGILEMDSAIPNNIVSGCHPYCSSSSYSLRCSCFLFVVVEVDS